MQTTRAQVASPNLRYASLFLCCAVALGSLAEAQTTRRVPSSYATVQDAVDASVDGDTVLLEPGVFRGNGNRNIDLGRKELTIRGEGGATLCTIDCQGTVDVPFRGIIVAGEQTSATVIEGLTIVGGTTEQGAIADPFNGAAIQLVGSSPIVRNCVFRDNHAACWGGAIFSGHGGSPTIQNCFFQDNFAGDGGAAIFSWDRAAPIVLDSVFVRNDGVTTGGAITHFSWPEAITIDGCTFVENESSWAKAAYISVGEIKNTIVWNGGAGSTQLAGGHATVRVTHSNIQGGLNDLEWDGGGNMNADPRFVNGFRLLPNSPCRDAGDPNAMTTGRLDIDGQPRVSYVRIDMGADEFRPLTRSFH